MGNENHHHSHHDFYHQNLHNYHRNTFMPMLCSKKSIKNVSLPQSRHHPKSFSNGPVSPRTSCMGQMKRDNKIAGFPVPTSNNRLSLTTKSITISISPIVKYSKLKKFFSAKNLTTATTDAPPSSCGSRQKLTRVLNCDRAAELRTNVDRRGRNCCRDADAGLQNTLRCGPQFKSLQLEKVGGADVPRNRNRRCRRNEDVVPVSIENMDPPLPVIKHVRKSEEGDSLWKRRSGGAALGSIQLHQILHGRRHLQLTSV